MRRLREADVLAVFDSLHSGKQPPQGLDFKIVPSGPNCLRLSPPSYAYPDGLYVLLKPPARRGSDKNALPTPGRAPSHLEDRVVQAKHFSSDPCPWILSGPQYPTPTRIQQRYCYSRGGNDAYNLNHGAALWTLVVNKREDHEFRVLDVYYLLQWRMPPERSMSDWTIQVICELDEATRVEKDNEAATFNSRAAARIEVYHVHKELLSFKSHYFAGLFNSTGSFQESKAGASLFVLHPLAAKAFPAFLDGVYNRGWLEITIESAVSLYYLCDYFQTKFLCDKIKKFISSSAVEEKKSQMIYSNCCLFYEHAQLFKMEEINNILARFVAHCLAEGGDKAPLNFLLNIANDGFCIDVLRSVRDKIASGNSHVGALTSLFEERPKLFAIDEMSNVLVKSVSKCFTSHEPDTALNFLANVAREGLCVAVLREVSHDINTTTSYQVTFNKLLEKLFKNQERLKEMTPETFQFLTNDSFLPSIDPHLAIAMMEAEAIVMKSVDNELSVSELQKRWHAFMIKELQEARGSLKRVNEELVDEQRKYRRLDSEMREWFEEYRRVPRRYRTE